MPLGKMKEKDSKKRSNQARKSLAGRVVSFHFT